ncbi:MAG: glycosyltransferase family 4 protein [Chloroflexi bacterium]|nr:glycosyltransferase family 4 protein [Chloroflexota bacterium]
MNVALLADNLTFGGVNRYCLDLAVELQTYPDVNLSLLALPDQSTGWLLQAAQRLGMPVQVLPMHNTFDLQVVGELRAWLTEQKIEMLHTQDYRGNIISRLAVRAGRLPIKLVATKHGLHYFPAASPRLRLFFVLDYLTMFMADRIIAVSKDTGEDVARWRVGRKVQVIHNGRNIPSPVTPQARQSSRAALGIPRNAKVVVFVGRLTHQKGIDALVDVALGTAATMDGVTFLLVGDGPCMPDMQARVSDSSQIRFMGQQEDVTPFYTAADVLFLPSRYEGLPMVLVEAFAHGVTAVASSVGGIPEVIVDGVNGFLCHPSDFDMMRDRLVQLLNNDALRLALGKQARHTAETSFSLEKMGRETYNLYRQLAQGGQDRP